LIAAYDGAEGGGRDALEGAREVDDVDDTLERVADPPVDQEVDVDRCVVARDRGLAGDLDELLTNVDLDRPVDDRDEEPETRIADHRFVGAAEPEDDHLLVVLDHPDRQVGDHRQDDDDERGDRGQDRVFHQDLRSDQDSDDDDGSGSTMTVRPRPGHRRRAGRGW
jgi:hypothetical protein